MIQNWSIWVMVTPVIPPKATYRMITPPSRMTPHVHGMPVMLSIRVPTPTIWAMM